VAHIDISFGHGNP